MKRVKLLIATAVASVCMSITALAGAWKADNDQWKFLKDDGTYYVSGWQWIDDNSDGVAECFYFDENGHLLMGTTSPDGYTINEKGEWTVDDVVQTKVLETAAAPSPTATSIPHVTETQAISTTAATTKTSSVANSSTVWISATGSKYYRKNNCGNMNPAKARSMSQSDAEVKGYEPCKKCY